MVFVKYFCLVLQTLFFLRVEIVNGQVVPVEKIAVGVIFDHNTDEIQAVFKYAMTMHNQNLTGRRFDLQAYVDVINTADSFKLSRLICNQFARGVFAMIGSVTPESFATLHSYTNTFQMPFVTPSFPEKVLPPSSLIDYAIGMRPNYHNAIVDIITHYGWDEVIYIYDSYDGLLRLQEIYQMIEPGETPFTVSIAKPIRNASGAIEFLLALEEYDRWGNKRIVLDCNAKNAKSILVEHVRNVRLGRRTYHYLLSGLVMDDHWENDVMEFGAVNITGFRIVDHSRKIVRDFMDGLRRMDPRFKGTISAKAALMYDGVQVLMEALGKLWRKKPDAFRNALRRASGLANTTKVIDCNPGKSWVVPFEHGDKISRLIKKTDMEGITGNISFNEEGHRRNFVLQVVEMTVQSAMSTVGTWTDKDGLQLLPPKNIPLIPLYDTNKTYIVTSLLYEPYMMQKSLEYGQKERYDGFCRDLTNLIALKLGIKYEIRITKDANFEGESTPEHLSSIVNELTKKGADIAVAPLAVTPERAQLVDFTDPFMAMVSPIKQTKNANKQTDTFGFLKPLSKEIWMCIIISFFAVSVVLFLVSRFSPHEWRSVSLSDTQSDQSITSTNEILLHNEFSIWNSLWFSLGSFMQQGSDVVPRSLSGRIVGTVWWFFALILVCSYTANLAAYLILEKVAEPNHIGHNLANTKKFQVVTRIDPIKDSGINVDETPLHFVPNSDGQLRCGSTAARACRYTHVNFAVATVKGSPLREPINYAIESLKKDRVLVQLWRKWVLTTKGPDCEIPNKEESLSEMTLSQVAGIFYVLVGGLTVALGVALFEFCQHGRAEAARANVTLRAALHAKAHLSSRDRKVPPQRTPQREQDRLGWNGAAFGYFTAGTQISQEDAVHATFTHV